MEAATGSRSVTLNLETPNIMQPCLEAEVACPASESPTSRIRYWKVPPQRHRQCQRTSAATFGRALPPHRPLPPHPADVIVAGPQPTRPHLRSYAGLPCPAHAAAPGSPPRLPTSRPPLCFRHGLNKPGCACLVSASGLKHSVGRAVGSATLTIFAPRHGRVTAVVAPLQPAGGGAWAATLSRVGAGCGGNGTRHGAVETRVSLRDGFKKLTETPPAPSPDRRQSQHPRPSGCSRRLSRMRAAAAFRTRQPCRRKRLSRSAGRR